MNQTLMLACLAALVVVTLAPPATAQPIPPVGPIVSRLLECTGDGLSTETLTGAQACSTPTCGCNCPVVGAGIEVMAAGRDVKAGAATSGCQTAYSYDSQDGRDPEPIGVIITPRAGGGGLTPLVNQVNAIIGSITPALG